MRSKIKVQISTVRTETLEDINICSLFQISQPIMKYFNESGIM